MVINLFLPKLSTWTIAKFTISTWTDNTLQTSVKLLRANTMVSAFTPDCGYDKSTIILFGNVHCPKTKCSGKFCLHKETFQSFNLAVNDLNQNITISSQENPLATRQLLLSQRQEILDNHLLWDPITPNQQGTFEMREEVLSNVFYSIYEEVPDKFLDKTDVDGYFCYNILDISQSHHRIVRVSKGSNKKSFAFKVVHFAIQSYSSDLVSRKKSANLKRKLILYSTVWANFSKLSIKPTKYRRFHYPNLYLRLDLQKQKTNCSVVFLQGYTWAFEQTKSIIVLVWEKQDLRFFDQKVWTLWYSIHSYKVFHLGYREIKHLNKNRLFFVFCCLQVWHFWEQLQGVADSAPVVGMTIALLFSLGTCILQTQSVGVKFVCTKRLLNLWAEAIINARIARLCVRWAIFVLKREKSPFFCRLTKGLHYWGESKINSRWYCRFLLSWQVMFEQTEMRSSWRLCNIPQIQSWLSKVWSLVFCSQSSFFVTRARKGHKNRQNTLFVI